MAQIWGLVLQWGDFWTLTRVTFWQNFTPKKKRQKEKRKKADWHDTCKLQLPCF